MYELLRCFVLVQSAYIVDKEKNLCKTPAGDVGSQICLRQIAHDNCVLRVLEVHVKQSYWTVNGGAREYWWKRGLKNSDEIRSLGVGWMQRTTPDVEQGC
jgi:hypothetical protein